MDGSVFVSDTDPVRVPGAIQGWWVNKAPAVKVLAVAGGCASIVLFVAAAAIDLVGGKDFADRYPFLGSVSGDLFKLAFLGTVALIVVDDLRAWGRSWSQLRPRVPELARAAAGLHNQILAALGVPALSPTLPTELFSVRRSFTEVLDWLRPLNRATDAIVDDPAELPDAPNPPFTSQAELDSVLKRHGQRALDFRHQFDPVDLHNAVTALANVIDLSLPFLSVSLQREAYSVSSRLPELEARLVSLSSGLHRLVTGIILSRKEAIALGEDAYIMSGVLHLIELLLMQIEVEAETGRPYHRIA